MATKNKKIGIITPYKEKIKILDSCVPLFTNDCSFTDDRVDKFPAHFPKLK